MQRTTLYIFFDYEQYLTIEQHVRKLESIVIHPAKNAPQQYGIPCQANLKKPTGTSLVTKRALFGNDTENITAKKANANIPISPFKYTI